MSSPNAAPTIYRHEGRPEWGNGVVVDDSEGKLTLVFEHDGAPKKFMKSMLSKALCQVTMPPGQANALEEKLRARKRPAAATTPSTKQKKSAPRKAVAAFESFAAQLAHFEKLFPRGFADERFIAEERGVAGSNGKDGHKERGMAVAAERLSPERFASSSPEQSFADALAAIQATNIAFPVEGAIAFKSIADADRPAVVVALRDLLHGEGDYAARFEKFGGSLVMKAKDGKAKAVAWPLATVLPALYRPAEHVAVKPTAFASQAMLVGVEVEKTQSVNGAGYAKFLEVARKTQQKLIAAGHAPRDLMDVYSFIYLTHAQAPRP